MPSIAASSAVSGSVADTLASTLYNYGVQLAFGIPGNDVLELIRACEESGIRFVLAKSESDALFMADAVYQLSGSPAAVILALGPGVANSIAGVAGALMERSALVVLGGEMASGQAGIYSHQVFDHVALMRPVVKHADNLNPARAAQQLARALDIASTYPAGPVFLNCPADFSRAPARQAAQRPPAQPAPTGLTEAAATAGTSRLATAHRPLALIGRGALHDAIPAPLRAFLERWRIPFLTTYKAKGVVPEQHPLSLGGVGLSPVVDNLALELVRQADLLIPIGFDPIELRDAWLDAWSPEQPCLSLDWQIASHRIFPTGTQLCGNLPVLLEQLAGTAASDWPPALLADYRSAVAQIVRARQPERLISPAGLFHAVNQRMQDDWWLTVDVGAHRILANHVLQCRRPGQLLQSNGLGCMGYALPAAIGAQLTEPHANVVALVGDGCMLMTLGELALAAELDLPLIVIVLNDASLALIELKQAKMQLAPRAVRFRSPQFDQLAAGFGASGCRVQTLAEFNGAFDQALTQRKLTLIDALIDHSEYREQM